MGEIATEKFLELYKKPEQFNKEIAYCISLDKEIDNNDIKEYLYRFHREEYRQGYQDEFAFHELLSSKKNELVKKANKYSFDQPFFMRVSQEFGNYDFDK